MKVINVLIPLLLVTTTFLPAMETAETTIFKAAQNGDVDTVQRLLIQNPSLIEAQDEDGYTLLHSASCCGNKYPMTVLPDSYYSDCAKVNYLDYKRRCFSNDNSQKYEQIVRILFVHGASANSQNKMGQTPLHISATEKIRCLLLEKGASINQQDNNGDTPLHRAVSAGYKDSVHFLLEHGASMLKNSVGATPLDLGKSEGFHVIADMIEQCLQVRRFYAAKLAFCGALHPGLGAHSQANIFPLFVVREILQRLQPSDFAEMNQPIS